MNKARQSYERILFKLIDDFFEKKDVLRESAYKNFKGIAEREYDKQ